MSDSIFNRPRRQFEPRMQDERPPESRGTPSRAPDKDVTPRRDQGADALMELARLIGQTDPFAPAPGGAGEGRKPDVRAPDVSRMPSSDFVRRDTPAAPPRAAAQPTQPDSDRFEAPHAEGLDFLHLPSRGEYPVAPRQALADHGDFDPGDRRGEPPMKRQHGSDKHQDVHDEYADEYPEDEYGQDDEYDSEHDSDDSESGSRRFNATKMVVVLLGLAVFGSAAAYGYRTLFKVAPSGPTPIIRADNSPTKVTPAGTEAIPKPINERVDDRYGERLVRRDEEPVDVGTSYRSGATGAAGGSVGASAPFADTSGSVPPATVPASGSQASPGDTKRVRTVTIRADQGTASPERTAPPRQVAVAAPSLPSPAPSPPAASLPPPPSPRQAALAPPPPISSSSPVAAPETAAPRGSDAGGGFVVQLSALRSEAEAQASFRTLQTKYSVLGGRQPLIRRKDQGERGIFYATQVGPFNAKSDADQLCETLKSAGGTCFVQKN